MALIIRLRPAPTASERHDRREHAVEQWERDIPLALANLALGRVVAHRSLFVSAALEILEQTSTDEIPPIAKRQILQNRGLFACIGFVGATARWDLTIEGHRRLRAVPTPSANLHVEAVREILSHSGMPL